MHYLTVKELLYISTSPKLNIYIYAFNEKHNKETQETKSLMNDDIIDVYEQLSETCVGALYTWKRDDNIYNGTSIYHDFSLIYCGTITKRIYVVASFNSQPFISS
jgi:hypothetical protein